MSSGYLGHCSGDGDTWADGFLSDVSTLGACPSSNPTVIIEATQIPQWFWLAAGVVALIFFAKRK